MIRRLSKRPRPSFEAKLDALKRLPGVREVKRVVCGGCHDFKVIVSFSKESFDETVGGFEGPFIQELMAVGGLSNVEAQTYTFMTV